MNPKISVIIPAHQEEEQIAETLNSLVYQSYDKFEVIVVANDCKDDTVKNAKLFNSSLALKIIETSKKGIGYACNLGFENSKGNIILILEADTTLSDNALEKIEKAATNGYVGGTLRMKAKEKRKRYWILTQLQKIGKGGGWGPVRFCTREVYNEIEGHREDADFGVDCVFSTKVKSKGKTAFINNAFFTTSMRRYEKKGLKGLIGESLLYIWYNVILRKFPRKAYRVIR